MTNLDDTLFSLEKYLGLELDSLLPLTAEDTLGGYHADPALRKWHTGAVWEVEGQILYALIRALKPLNCVEIGSGDGCSANHTASALKANGGGHVTTIDRGNTPLVLAGLENYVTVISGDGVEWLANQPDNSIDFIVEDADHTEAMCYEVAELAKSKLKPGGVLLSHDAAHFAVGQAVRAGYDRAGLDYRLYLTEPSDCGWLVWQRPSIPSGDYVENPAIYTVKRDGSATLERPETLTPVEKPKRKRTKKAVR